VPPRPPCQPNGVVDGELLFAVQAATKRLPLDKGHDVVKEAVRLAGVDQAENVGMLQAGGGLDLAEEPVHADDSAQLRMQDLDGDLAVVLQVLGEIHGGHAALTKLAVETVTVAQRRGEAARDRRAQLRLRVRCRSSSRQFMTIILCAVP
jgi:hypothetical protein